MEPVHRLRLVWTGLDLFELAAMVATGIFIRRFSPDIAVSTAAIGTLLTCDAWFNVTASTGSDQLVGIALAFVEVPIAIFSFVLAVQDVHQWGGQASQTNHGMLAGHGNTRLDRARPTS